MEVNKYLKVQMSQSSNIAESKTDDKYYLTKHIKNKTDAIKRNEFVEMPSLQNLMEAISMVF